MSATEELVDPHAEAAIDWMVEMRSGEMSERQHQAFLLWMRADPANEAAWIRLQEGLMPCGVAARHGVAVGDLARRRAAPQRSRRTFLTGLIGIAGAGAGGLGVLDRFVPLGGILADRVTFTGGQEKVGLTDGSDLVLGARTAVDIRYETGLRAVNLIAGEIMVRIAPRATPFHLRSGPVTLAAQSGGFVVENRDGRLTVTGVNGAGEMRHDAATGPVSTIAAGEAVEFFQGRVNRFPADVEMATAWLDGLMVAKDSRVGAIVAKLRPYFPGVIEVDRNVADLRVSGVFSLKDPNATCAALAEFLDFSLRRVTPYWLKLGPASGSV